ncbi:MAG TPA: formylmethanofuran dehydrogenase subunit C [Anaerolineaceae bacterium]|nr:formylmethanofuran dehydrogenase subunit C [Anaerolineaceae bacterium]
MTTLKLNLQSNIPLEAGTITPDQFQDKSPGQIAKLPVVFGNEPFELGDFFTVDADGSNDIILKGDASRVKHIGEGMTKGNIIVEGNAGMHLGAGMRGGFIRVEGNAGDWAGAEMAGGLILIKGNAGHALGGAYRGSRRGMTRGRILVNGNAGNETGSLMRRGLIAVGGSTGEFTGCFMIAGTVIVFGQLGARPGPGMKHGTLITFQTPELLPTFRYACTYQPGFLGLILQSLRSQGVPVVDEYLTGRYRRYSGDFTALGKGEILVYDQH